MFDSKLTKTGSILMHDGKIQIEGFRAENAGCREVVALALLWAIGELQEELTAIVHHSDNRKSCLDFSPELNKLLGIDPWEDFDD